MTHKEIVMKLIGPIAPLGDSGRDEQRLENMKALCALIDELYDEIDNVAIRHGASKEHSVKKIVDEARHIKRHLASRV